MKSMEKRSGYAFGSVPRSWVRGSMFLSGQKNFAFITWVQSYCEGLDILWCWIPCRVIDKTSCVKLASEGYW